MICIGIDPGQRYTGIVVRTDTPGLIGARVLDRERVLDALVDIDPIRRRKAWASLVCATVAEFRADIRTLDRRGLVCVAVENVVAPHPHGGKVDGGKPRVIKPGPIIDTAVVMGAVMDRFDAYLINPNRFGTGQAKTYPKSIQRQTDALGGPSKHAKAAWDVAGQALLLHRLSAPTTTRETRT